MPELRKDPVVGRWVIISTERSLRPTSFSPETHSSAPLLPVLPRQRGQHAGRGYAVRPARDGVPNGPGWTVRVVPNKFPRSRSRARSSAAAKGCTTR